MNLEFATVTEKTNREKILGNAKEEARRLYESLTPKQRRLLMLQYRLDSSEREEYQLRQKNIAMKTRLARLGDKYDPSDEQHVALEYLLERNEAAWRSQLTIMTELEQVVDTDGNLPSNYYTFTLNRVSSQQEKDASDLGENINSDEIGKRLRIYFNDLFKNLELLTD